MLASYWGDVSPGFVTSNPGILLPAACYHPGILLPAACTGFGQGSLQHSVLSTP